MPELSACIETFALRNHFTISRGSKTETVVVTATVSDGDVSGRGECGPNARYAETPESVHAAILDFAPNIAKGLDRHDLASRMPAGAARNAIDCALWDYEAKRSGEPVWRIAGLTPPQPLDTAFTLSADTPGVMARAAAENAHRPVLKLKLTGDDDEARVRAVRDAAPGSDLIVDANEAWDVEAYEAFVPVFLELGVRLIEQPFPAEGDDALASLDRPIPVCADESFHDTTSLEGLGGRYDVVNIKLDKTGGLTGALVAAEAAQAAGFDIMVGCMVGTSLAMAPAFLVAQGARFVDLDGPLLLRQDRESALRVNDSRISPPGPALWG